MFGNEFDLKKLYDISKLIHNMDNDFEVLEEMMDLLPALEQQAALKNDSVARLSFVVDDTTNVYMNQLVDAVDELINEFEVLCEEFLGISEEQRKKAIEALDKYLVSVALIMFKCVGYEDVAQHLAVGNKDFSNLTLSTHLLGMEDVKLKETLDLIFVIFKDYNAYFAEYQIGDEELLDELLSKLETSSGDEGTLAIAGLSKKAVDEQLKKLEGEGIVTRKK